MSKTAAVLREVPPFAPETMKPPPIMMLPIGDLYLATEAPKGANLVVRDSSRGSPMTDAELKASIYAKGVLHPLIWKELPVKTARGEEMRRFVVAGNRRLRFLREIFADALASPVQTQNVDDFEGDWREIAGDTNISLPPHLVERYELIVALAKDLKLSPADVCARYGMSDQQYRRVMALGKMADVVREAWKNAEIDAKTAQAFTLEPDPKEQEKIFLALKKGGRVSDWEVRRRIVPVSQQEAGKLVAFVGLEAVRKAKLLKQEDLFAGDKRSDFNHIVTDIKGLNKLVGDRIAAKCEELVEAGWKWALPEDKIEGQMYYYGTIEPKKTSSTAEEKKRLDQITKTIHNDDIDSNTEENLMEEGARIEQAIALRGYTPEQMKKGGCILKIGRDGMLVIEYGKIKPAEKKQVQASERPKAKPKPKKPGVVTLTNALADRLSLQLEEALAKAIVKTPHVAVAAMIAGFSSGGHVMDVGVGGGNGHSGGGNEKNFVQIFEGAMKASPESRVVMLTEVAKEALSIQIHTAEAEPPLEDKGLQALISQMSHDAVNAAIEESFDAKGYFDAVNLEACVAAVRCSMGDDHAAKVAKMKKGKAAEFAAANVPKTGWLPKQLRTVHYDGPVEAEAAKKMKKPKPVKKAPAKKKRK